MELDVAIWVEAGRSNEAVILIKSIQEHSPKANIFVYYVDGEFNKVFESVKRKVPVSDGHPLLTAIDDLKGKSKVVVLRANSLVCKDISELAEAPLNTSQIIAAVKATRCWGIDSKMEEIKRLSPDVFKVGMRIGELGPANISGMVVNCQAMVGRAVSANTDSLSAYARYKSDEIGSLMEFINHMSPERIGLPDAFFGTSEWVGHTLISPKEQCEYRLRIRQAKIISYQDPNFTWGDENIYKSAYLQLDSAPMMDACKKYKDSIDQEFYVKVAKTHELTRIHDSEAVQKLSA